MAMAGRGHLERSIIHHNDFEIGMALAAALALSAFIGVHPRPWIFCQRALVTPALSSGFVR